MIKSGLSMPLLCVAATTCLHAGRGSGGKGLQSGQEKSRLNNVQAKAHGRSQIIRPLVIKLQQKFPTGIEMTRWNSFHAKKYDGGKSRRFRALGAVASLDKSLSRWVHLFPWRRVGFQSSSNRVWSGQSR